MGWKCYSWKGTTANSYEPDDDSNNQQYLLLQFVLRPQPLLYILRSTNIQWNRDIKCPSRAIIMCNSVLIEGLALTTEATDGDI
jgi:hypothetical protein